MTYENAQTSEAPETGKSKLPTHVAKVRHGYGKNASFEQIGVAWVNEKGGIYVKLHGTQIVSAFTLFEVKRKEETVE